MATRSKRNVLCPTCIRDSGPLKPGTVSPSTNLSCEIRMCTAAAVVNPDISVSDRYMTINPTCSSPIPSWKQIERRYILVWLKTIIVFKLMRGWLMYTWNRPTRKVREADTKTLCSSFVRPSKAVMLAGGPSSGTRRVTTAPTMRLSTGKDPGVKNNTNGE